MSTANPSLMTYGEFIQRRAALLAQLHAAQRLLQRVSDPAYTPLVPNAVELAQTAVRDAENAILLLVANFNAIPRPIEE